MTCKKLNDPHRTERGEKVGISLILGKAKFSHLLKWGKGKKIILEYLFNR